MKVIFENDDLSLNYGFTEGIKKAFTKGITTSTCMRVNGLAFDYALKLLKKDLKQIGLGIHIDLTHGPFETEKPTIFSAYALTFIECYFRSIFFKRSFLNRIEKEVEAQINKAKKHNLNINHINGHDHIHMIPAIFEIFCKLSNKHKIPYIRLTDEPFIILPKISLNIRVFTSGNILRLLILKIFAYKNKRLIQKYKLKTVDAYFGLLHSNYMNTEIVLFMLKECIKRKYTSIEIASHPATVKDERDKKLKQTKFMNWYTNLHHRTEELNALTSKKLKKYISDNNLTLVSYKDL